MNPLDRIAAFLDRREVLALRSHVAQQQAEIAELTRKVAEQTDQIASANLRVSRTTNLNLDALRRLRDHSISTEGLQA